MKESKDEKVKKFLDDIEEFDTEKSRILQDLRKIVFTHYPQVSERMMYGGIMFSLGEDFGGIFVRKNHISFEFSEGVLMKDPNAVLEGTGELRRHLKIKSLEEIKDKNVDFFVRQAS
ncbi:MAG: DUF1801 domain-containing protein [Candidatus Thorarchaeota archaeon]